MEFRQLRHFVAVVTAGNFSKASDIVYITQPALTRSIQALEHEVGEQLLLRLPTGVIPTKAGELLFKQANSILNDWSHTKSEIIALKNETAGHLSIGIAPLFGHGVMRRIIKDFRKNNHGASLSVIQGRHVDLRDHLLAGECDVLLTVFPPELDQKAVEYRACFEIEAGVLASADHPLAHVEYPAADELAKADWALFSRSNYHVNTFLIENNIDLPTPLVSTNSLSLLIKLLHSGQYLTSLAPLILIDEIEAGEIKVLQMPKASTLRTAGLVYNRKQEVRPLLNSFTESVLTIAEELTRMGTAHKSNSP